MPAIVHIVDDDSSFRTSTGRLLRACGYAVETYEICRTVLEALTDHPSTRLHSPRHQNPRRERAGITGPPKRSEDRVCPSSFLTGHADIPTTVQVIKAGADDLLTKPVAKDTLVQAIELALARCPQLRDKHEQLDVLRTLVSHLSPRERQVFERVVRGKMNKEIARELGTTERTIKAHRLRVWKRSKQRHWPS